ncbi:MAG: Sir2 family NAD-dependent protein deacetylase [Pseudomonadales bacterium]|nr:Sir2 family NAD-dependent protein deacetylase [Pseudomonadales bacterium]
MATQTISEEELMAFRQQLKEANDIVVFTGAGISTESGIPDFRGPNGIWKSIQPIDFSDFVASEEVKKESWRRKFSTTGGMNLNIDGAEPNAGHRAIAELATLGKLGSIITQNVDGLHQKSGVPEEQIIELHGNANYAACLDCSKRYELDDIRQVFLQDETLPICDHCSGSIKTATISFGQAMPVKAMEFAQQATLKCDLFMAIGSSLTVYPAAGFPRLAKQNGARLIILNNEATDLDQICDLVLHYPIGATLTAGLSLLA